MSGKLHSMTAISESDRQNRRDRASRLVAEGKIGGARFGALGGRPSAAVRVLVGERAGEAAEEIVAALRMALAEGTPAERMRAVELWLRLAREAAEATVADVAA